MKQSATEFIAKVTSERIEPQTNLTIFKPVSGVYFLLDGEQIVYVGQSTNIASRIQNHTRDKKFSGAFYFPMDSQIMGAVEKACIDYFRPPLNLGPGSKARTAVPKLTKTSVEAFIASAKPTDFIWDSTMPGFGVRKTHTNSAAYVVRYRTVTGTQRKFTIGKYPKILPDEARDIARVVFVEIAKGNDPASFRKHLRQSPTIADLAKRHLEEHAKLLKPRTVANYEILWRIHIVPRFGNVKVVDLNTSHVLELRAAMARTPINANRAREMLSKAMDLAVLWGWRPANTNPCTAVTDFPEKVREQILTETEIAKLAVTLVKWEADEPALVALVRALMFTGCRVNEIASARRAWLNPDTGRLHLPDSKTGPKVVELPPLALEALQGIGQGSVWLVPNKRGTGPLTGFWRRWKRLREAAGLPGLRLHDLRHTVGSLAHRNGATQRQVADLLGHKQISTAARYIHGFSEDRRIVAARAAEAMQAAMQKAPG